MAAQERKLRNLATSVDRRTYIKVDDEGLFNVNDLEIIKARLSSFDLVLVERRPLGLKTAYSVNVVLLL